MCRSKERSRGCLQSVQLVLCIQMPGDYWCGHGLLTHLTLVHVPRRLIEIWQRNCTGQVGQKVGGFDFFVCGKSGHCLTLFYTNFHVNLVLAQRFFLSINFWRLEFVRQIHSVTRNCFY